MVFLLPAGAIAYYIYMPKSNVNIGIAVLLAAAGIALNKPLQALRVKYRHDVEYDEFGRSKSKGNYEYLSKAERDKMDLQKTLDMERIMDSSALKKMTKKGAKDPEKEMNSLVGLVPVKNIILAGYTNEMKRLLEANPGFESRIKEYLVFPDYDDMEMRQIFAHMANEQNFVVKDESYEAFDERVLKERKLKSFGNGRTARNILDETIDRHALNFMDGRISSEDKGIWI